MTDGRPNPEIPTGTIAQLVAEMPIRGQTSINEVDRDARDPENIHWFGAGDREYDMAASDTTIFRSLGCFSLNSIHEVLWENAGSYLREPQSKQKLPSGQTVRIGSLDGSQWGRYPGSVLTILGTESEQVAGYRMSPGKGHELATSSKLESEAVRQLGTGYIDYLVKDALYVTEDDIQRARQGGYDLVTKTEDESIRLIQKARPQFYWRFAPTPEDKVTVEGTDPHRGCSYEITCSAQFCWQGQQVKLAHVKETYHNPKPDHPEETEYWVITTDLEMDPHDMREVKILRWNIENRLFRQLNQLAGSKRKFTEDEHVREALLGLWFIGLNLLGLIVERIKEPFLKPVYQTMKRTWRWFGKQYEKEIRRTFYQHQG